MIKTIDYNYHVHTKRCGHAVGEDEQYILSAINNGIKKLGFSEHIPLVREDDTESRYRMPITKCQDYFDSIRALREKYKDKIEIFIGFEMEYYPEYFDVMLKTAKEYGAEYLILGQHFIAPEHKGAKYVYTSDFYNSELTNYVNVIISAIKTGLFTYVAHPDMIRFGGDKEWYDKEMSRLITTAKELDIPLELNLKGVRDNRSYPNEEFFKLVGKLSAPVVIGGDTHDFNDFSNLESFLVAFKMIKDYKLNFFKNPKIRRIDK